MGFSGLFDSVCMPWSIKLIINQDIHTESNVGCNGKEEGRCGLL